MGTRSDRVLHRTRNMSADFNKRRTIKKRKQPGPLAALRRNAEKKLKSETARLQELSSIDLKKLVHELGTHQIEIEMQNEELRRAQAELESSRAGYADLYDFAPAGYFTFDRRGLIKEVNLAGAVMLGHERRFLLGKPVVSFIEPVDRTIFRDHLREVFEIQTPVSCEITLVKKNGIQFNSQWNSIFNAGNDGGPDLCRTTVSDVTERKRVEDKLKESEKKYRSLFENMLDGFAFCKMLYDGHDRPVDFVYLDVNSAFERLTGLANVVGKKVSEVIPGIRESYPVLFEIYGRVAQTGKPESFEIYLEPLAAWLFVSVYSTEKGYFVAVFDNITERKRAESIAQARLRMLSMIASPAVSRDETLQLMLDEIERQTGSTIGFYHFLDVDQETLSLQAWSTNTLRNMCTAEGTGSHYNISRAGVWVDCVREQRPVIHNDYASLANRKGLPPGHAEVRREMVVPILRGGRIAAIIGVGNKPTDYNAIDVEIVQSLGQLSWEIFERMRAVDELQTAHAEVELRSQELAATNKELEAFSYSVSHDLRNPLNRILGFSDVLLEDYSDKLDDEGKNHLNRVIKNATKMNRIMEDLLHLSRLSRHEMQRQDIDLSKIAASVAAELREAQPDRRVTLDIQDGITAFADAKLIGVAVSNLLGNAWKFTSKAENARIELGTFERDGKTVYYVKDNGAGFDQSFSDKLFLPFQRLHSEDEFEGTGIGLAIVERVIRRHGGNIWAEGKTNEGAAIFFTLS